MAAMTLQWAMVVVVMMATMTTVGGVAIRREEVIMMEVDVEERERPQGEMTPPANLPNLPALVQQLELTDLYGAVGLAGLAGTLSQPGPFTLFAPTNQAFDNAKTLVDYLKSNVTALGEVLKYHVLTGKVFSSAIKDELSVPTLQGKPLRFNIYPNNVVTAQCAPIDLNKVNVNASNGVLHELTAIMVPPVGNIAQAAVLSNLSTLVTALQAADLVDTLSGEGPFTVFAPTNEAFAKLGPKLDELLKNKTALTDVLLYHVTKLTYCTAGLKSYSKLKMLNGQEVQITNSGNDVKVNKNLVKPAGVHGGVTNGVIHVIDSVLIPPSLSVEVWPKV